MHTPARRRRDCRGRARPENPQTLGRAVRREGCRHDVGLGRAPPCDPVPTSPSVPKAKLLLEHEDAGRTGRRSTLKGKGDSGGGCKEGPRGGNRRFPTTGPSLAPPGGHRGNYRRTGIKRENSDVTPPLPRAKPLCSLPACSNKSFAFGTGGRKHPSPHGGRHEVTTRVFPFVCTPARRRRDCRGAGTT